MRASNIFSAMKVGMLVLFIAGGLIALALHPELRVPLHFTPTTAEGWFEALLLLVFGYGGFEGALIVGRVRDSKDENFGFNAETGEFGDLVKAGVIDPAKVTRLALQNAASIVSLMLTTEVLIAEAKGEEKVAAAGGGMGGSY